MNLREALVRNTAWYGVVTVLGLLAGLVTSVLLARGLGPARLGDYSYLLWISRVLAAFAMLGFPAATVRYTADALARGEGGLAWGFVRLFHRRQALTTTVVAALAAPFVWLAPADLRLPLLVLVLALYPDTLEAVYTSALYGAHRYDVTARNSMLKMALHLAAIAAALAAGAGLLGLTLGVTLGTVVTWALQRRRAQRLYPVEAAVAVAAATRRDVRRFLLPLSMVTVLDMLVWDRSEVFFLRLYTSPESIAYYSLAFGLATKAMVLPEVAVGALLPTLAALHGRGEQAEFRRVYRTAVRYVALIGAALAAVGVALAPALVTLLYGEAYLPVANLLAVLAVVAVLSALRKVAWAALRAAGDRHAALAAMGVSATVDLSAAALLIPGYGTTGAVIASSAAQLVATTWGFVAVARLCGAGFPALDLVRTAAAGSIALAATWLVAGESLEPARLAAAGVAGVAAFAALAIATGLVGAREWTIVRLSARRSVAPRTGGARA